MAGICSEVCGVGAPASRCCVCVYVCVGRSLSCRLELSTTQWNVRWLLAVHHASSSRRRCRCRCHLDQHWHIESPPTHTNQLDFYSDHSLSYSQGSYSSGKTGKSQGIWVVREMSGENIFLEKSGKMKNWCHQRSNFQAKMRQIRFPLEVRLRPRWGSLQWSPRPPSCT